MSFKIALRTKGYCALKYMLYKLTKIWLSVNSSYIGSPHFCVAHCKNHWKNMCAAHGRIVQ